MNNPTVQQIQKPFIYHEFRHFYENYLTSSHDKISAIYAEDIIFRDPVHTIEGILPLMEYFKKVSARLQACQFEFVDEIVTPECAHITWNMKFKHPLIAKGNLTTLRGMTLIKYNDKIYFHEDTYDLGAMLYENLPVIGKFTRLIKNRIGK